MRRSRRARRRVVLVVGLMLVAGAAAVTYKTVRGAQETRLLHDSRVAGIDAFEEGDYERALERLNYVVSKDKSDYRAMLAFAEARARIPKENGGHLVEAVAWHNKIRLELLDVARTDEQNEVYETAQASLLDLYAQLGQRVELLEISEDVLKRNPDHHGALTARVRALFVDRQFDEAMSVAQRLAILQPQDPQWRELQLIIIATSGGSERALLDQCDQWIAAESDVVALRLLKARWLVEFGRLEDASVVADSAAAMPIDSLDVLQTMVELLDQLNRHDAAADTLARARAQFPKEQWVRLIEARRLLYGQDAAAGLAVITEAEADFGTLSPALMRMKAILLMAVDEPQQAEAVIDMLTQQASGSNGSPADETWATAMRTRLQSQTGALVDLLAACEEALRRNPDDAMLHYLVGEAQSEAGDLTSALQAYEQAFRRAPNWMATGIAYGETLLRLGRAREALDVSRIVLSRSQRHTMPAYLLLARSMLAVERMSDRRAARDGDVVAVLIRLVEQAPDNPSVVELYLRALLLRGARAEAIAFIDETLQRGAARPQEVSATTLLVLAEVSIVHSLQRDVALLDAADVRGGPTVASALLRANLAAEAGDVQAGLDLIDAAMPEDAPLAARTRRVLYMSQFDHPDALEAVRDLVADAAQSASTLVFVLDLPTVWSDEQLTRRTIDQLAALTGAQATGVRLADARWKMRFRSDSDAALADAILAIQGVLDESPRSLRALVLLADALLVGEHASPGRAADALRKAIDLYPGQYRLYPRVIALLQQAGEYEKADLYLRRLSRVARDNRDLARREIALLQSQGNHEAALVRARSLSGESDELTDQLALAAMHVRAGQPAEAEIIYDALLQEAERNDLVVAQAASFFARTERFARGLDLLRGHESPQQAILIGLFHQRYGESDEATMWFRRATEQHPDDVVGWSQLARQYMQRAEFAPAHDAALRGLRVDPRHAGLRATLALCDLNVDATARAEAIAQLRDATDTDDGLIAMLEVLQQVDREDGGWRPSAGDLAASERLIDEFHRFLPAWQMAVMLHVHGGKPMEAIELARRAVGRFPTMVEPARWATNMLVEVRQWEDASIEVEEWRRRAASDSFEPDVLSAAILMQLGRPQEAMHRLQPHALRIVAEGDDDPEPLAHWLRAQLATGDVDAAVELIRPRLDDPRWASAWLALVEVTPEALGPQVLSVFDDHPTPEPALQLRIATAWLGLAARGAGEICLDRGAAWAERAEVAGGDWTTRGMMVRGAVAEARGDHALAEQLYRDVLVMQPDFVEAMNNLAVVLLANPQSAAAALEYAAAAAEQAPTHPDILDTYGQALAAAGRHQEATDALRRASDLRPADVEIGLNLVQSLLAAGESDEARQLLRDLQRRLDRDPSAAPMLQRRADELRQLSRRRAAAGE